MSSFLSGEYPESWDEYVGQDRAKRSLITKTRSAAKLGENMEHTLIACPVAGIGKTALAQLMIRQLARPHKIISGQLNLAKARIMFAQVSDGDVVFWDEFHKAVDGGGKRHIEWMLHYLENGTLITPFGEEPVPKVTFICATTDKGVLPEPILDRFYVVDLVDYTDAEGQQIASTMAGKVLGAAHLPGVSPETAAAVAMAASNRPRMMRQVLRAVRDLAVIQSIEVPEDGVYDLIEALEMVDLTPDGLGAEAREYLRIMYVESRGEAVGEAYLKRRMGTVGKGLELIERSLTGKGLIQHTKQGRMLTGPGIKRAVEIFGTLDSLNA